MEDFATIRMASPAPRRHRIHIFGASGAGTSTLGRALASALGSQHFDTDDFYWHPTDPPFRAKRDPQERCDLMQAMFLPRADWVLSGSLDSWGETVVPRMTAAIHLTLSQPERRTRLEARERLRHGGAMAPGGPAHDEVRAFLAWADGYEAGLRPGRSRARHEAWAETLPCPVIPLASNAAPDVLAAQALAALEALPTPATA